MRRPNQIAAVDGEAQSLFSVALSGLSSKWFDGKASWLLFVRLS